MLIAHNLWKYRLTSKMRAEIGLKKYSFSFMVIFVMLTLLLNIILTVFVRKREYLKKPLNLCISYGSNNTVCLLW